MSADATTQEWTQESAKMFFQEHFQQVIEIREKNSQLKIVGEIQELNSLDLCDRLLHEAHISFVSSDLAIDVTLHEAGLGVQVFVEHQGQTHLSLPHQISYSCLELHSLV